MSRFGKKVEEYRERLGIKQNALAKRIGLSPAHLNRIEKGTRKPPQVEAVLALVPALHLTPEEAVELVELAGYSPEVLQRGGVLALPLPTKAYPAIATPSPTQQPPSIQLPAADQRLEELKVEMAEVKATVKEMHSYLRDLVRSLVPQTTPAWDDLDGQQIRAEAISGSGQEPTDSKHPESNPVMEFVEEVIEAVNNLPDLDKPRSGQIMLTYLVEKDAFGGDQELEEQWLAMFEGAIDKGWDIVHLIWLNEDKERTSHVKRNFHSLSGRRGDYQVYYAKTAPLGHGVDYVAVDAEKASLKRAFVYEALKAIVGGGLHDIENVSAIYPTDKNQLKQIEDILARLNRWKKGEFERLLNVEHLQKLQDEMAK